MAGEAAEVAAVPRAPPGCVAQALSPCFPPPRAAELASLLVRSISYELPSLRKQISRCQQAQQDCVRREEECQLGAAELRERFCSSCKQYGITVSDPAPALGSSGCPRGAEGDPATLRLLPARASGGGRQHREAWAALSPG